MDKQKALSLLLKGKKLTTKSWDAERYIYADEKSGQIIDSEGNTFNMMATDINEWIEWSEPKADGSDKEIEELKNMVKELLKENKRKESSNSLEIVKSMYGVTSPSDVKRLFKKRLEDAKSSRDIERVVCEFIPYCYIGKNSIHTIKNIYTDFRKVIKELNNETYKDVALTLFLPPQALYEASQSKVDGNKKEKIRNKNTFDATHINNLLKTIKARLNSKNENEFEDKPRQTTLERERAYWAYTYLTIVTGRRQAEILKTLSIVKKEDGWYYCGISKDRKDGKCIKAYSLDDDYEFLNELLNYIHNHIGSKELTQREINSKFNNPFNNALKRITGEHYTAKEWREIYTEMLWLKNGGEGSNIDKRDFRAEILGHKYDGKLSATEHYEGWEAIDEK